MPSDKRIEEDNDLADEIWPGTTRKSDWGPNHEDEEIYAESMQRMSDPEIYADERD